MIMVLGLATVGCGDDGGFSEADPQPEPTPEDEPTDGFLHPTKFMLSGFFGYEADTNQIVNYSGVNSNGEAFNQEPVINLFILEQGYLDGEDNKICVFSIKQPAPFTANWGDVSYPMMAGFFADWASATVETNCDNEETLLDPAIWGNDPTELIKQTTFGTGLVGPLDNRMSNKLQENNPTTWATDWEPHVMGGGWHIGTTGTVPGESLADQPDYALVFPIEGSMETSFSVPEASTPINKAALLAPTDETGATLDAAAVSGAYTIRKKFIYKHTSDTEEGLRGLLGGEGAGIITSGTLPAHLDVH